MSRNITTATASINMNTLICCAALGLLLSLLLVGCGGVEYDADDNPLATANQAALITELALDNGAVVKFYEPLPGELVISTTADSKDKLVTIEALRGNSSAAQVYRSLSGREPPAALVEADKRVLAAQVERPTTDWHRQQSGTVIDIEPDINSEPQAGQSQDGIGVKESALGGYAPGMTVQEFETYCCPTEKNYWFKHCWPNRTGTSGIQRVSPSIHSIVYAKSGKVAQQLFEDGIPVAGFVVNPGNWAHLYWIGATTLREARANGQPSYNAGAWSIHYYYHHSVFGGWTSCGDANGDGVITSEDANFIRDFLKGKGPAPSPYWSGDANGDGYVTYADKDAIMSFLYHGGPKPTC